MAVNVEPNTQKFLDALSEAGGPPIYTVSPKDARAVREGVQVGEVAKLAVDIDDRTVSGGPNGPVSVRIVRPKGALGMLRAVPYFHGRGWILGRKHTHDRLTREIATGAQAPIVFVNFTPAPEAKYPVQIEEAYAVAKWVAEQLRGLPPALVISGENNVLHDEGEAYAHRLAQARARVTAVRYLATIHDFVMLNATTNAPAARS
jgi:acetyl esterase/lipase